MSSLIEIRGVTKVYGDDHRALAGIDLDLEAGQTLGLIGESGSGKSTLLRLLNRMEEPSQGSILLEGTPLCDLDPISLRRKIGYVPQNGGLLPHWSVGRNIELVPELLGWQAERRRQRSRELLDAVGLEPERYVERPPRSLSGGERQRVAFARALAADPDLMLLDEPFGALDAINRYELHQQFEALQARFHKTTVLVSHDLSEACQLSDRIAVLLAGEILQHDTPTALRADPAHPYVARLLNHLERESLR